MAILANRVKIKNNLVELSKFTLFSIKKFFSLILLAISCYLLYFPAPAALTSNLLNFTGKFLSFGSVIYQKSIEEPKKLYQKIIRLKDLEEENIKLKTQLNSLQNIQRISMNTHLENLALKEILNFAKEANHNFITAKILGASINPFSSSLIIQAGSANGVKINDIVRGKKGLVGRISHVGPHYSTVMLVNDHNSRVPVITGNSKIRGVLAKQGNSLKIIYLDNHHNAKNGEVVYTSGDGKIYSKGIAVATIQNVNNEEALVQTIENFDELEYVMVTVNFEIVN